MVVVQTADQLSQQMIAQFRLLDASGSAEIGTPERKIFDTVAAALANAQVGLTGLSGAMDIGSKYGSNLDRFTALFGFQRQQAVAANGFVIFSTNAAAIANINIPAGTVVQGTALTTSGQTMQYLTTAGAAIQQDATSSNSTPVQCTLAGSGGNAAANTLTGLGASPPPGVTSVNNANAIDGGIDQEDDNSYKVRFKNTVFRNMAGTEDQYLALACSTAYTTKANVIGPQSNYQEYMQVPAYDDNGYLNGVRSSYTFTGTASAGTITGVSAFTPLLPTGIEPEGMQVTDSNGNNYLLVSLVGSTMTISPSIIGSPTTSFSATWETPGGPTGSWTTAQSIIPYAAEVYTSTATFVSNGQGDYFYRPGVDFQFNYPSLQGGDWWRDGTTVGAIAPNITFLQVFNPSNDATIAGLQSVTPQDVVLVQFCYRSSASRNSVARNINNAVDIYVNGSNDIQGSCIFIPALTGSWAFTGVPNATTYYENYRRDGNKIKRPQLGNYLTPLFNEPVDGLPDTITVAGVNYYLGVHYWLVHEIGPHEGSIRARDGIEWSNGGLGGDPTGTDQPTNPLAPYQPGGATILASQSPTPTQIEVDNYLYDSNIVVIAGAVDNARQITTDVLVHKNKVRYFKLDITVIYTQGTNATGTNQAVTNNAISTAIQTYFNNQYFGAVIQLSSLLGTIYNVAGVGNVRWSNDLPSPPNLVRVLETDVNGNPLHGASIDRLMLGTVSSAEQQSLYIAGAPSGVDDSFTLSWTDPLIPGAGNTMTTAPILFSSVAIADSTSATVIQTAIQAAATAASVTSGVYDAIAVVANNRPTTNVVDPLISYTIGYGNGTPYLPTITNSIVSSTYTFDSDFFLLDDELPSLPTGALATDTLAGLIIRPRAESTFYQVS